MTEHLDPAPSTDPLDGLVTELLECGAVLSQIVTRMVQFQAAGRSAPDAVPIPEAAHAVVRGAIHSVKPRHSKRDIKVATAIVAEATTAITDNVFFLGPELN